MNKDQVKGTIDDAAGRAKRQVGEWTGDTNAQAEGMGQQVKGKLEKGWGAVKDAAHSAHDQVKEHAGKAKAENNREWNESRERESDDARAVPVGAGASRSKRN